jgi:hypothetical protein
MTSVVLFTVLHYGLGTCQVDLDLYTSGLMLLTPFGVNKQEHVNGAKKAESPPAPVRPVRRTGQTGVLGFAYFEHSGG